MTNETVTEKPADQFMYKDVSYLRKSPNFWGLAILFMIAAPLVAFTGDIYKKGKDGVAVPYKKSSRMIIGSILSALCLLFIAVYMFDPGVAGQPEVQKTLKQIIANNAQGIKEGDISLSKMKEVRKATDFTVCQADVHVLSSGEKAVVTYNVHLKGDRAGTVEMIDVKIKE